MANYHITLVQWGYDSELNLSQTLLDVFTWLPVHLQRKFRNKVDAYSIGYAATFSQLLSFIEDAADRANLLFGQALAQPPRYNQSCPRKLKSGQLFAFQAKTIDEMHCQRNPRDVCPSCNCNNHTLSKCRTFLRKPIQERWRFVKGKRLCFNCLGVDHMSRDCKCESKCKACSRPHHTVLHREFAQPNRRSNLRRYRTQSSAWCWKYYDWRVRHGLCPHRRLQSSSNGTSCSRVRWRSYEIRRHLWISRLWLRINIALTCPMQISLRKSWQLLLHVLFHVENYFLEKFLPESGKLLLPQVNLVPKHKAIHTLHCTSKATSTSIAY